MGFPRTTQWTIGGGQPPPPPRKSYREARSRSGRLGRVVHEEGDQLLVAFYATGEELIRKEDVTLGWRHP